MAAIDDAIADGVDVLSISIGTEYPLPYIEDSIAIGALHACYEEKHCGVMFCRQLWPKTFNFIPPGSMVITVGASSVDREFFSPVVLGNGMGIEVRTYIRYENF